VVDLRPLANVIFVPGTDRLFLPGSRSSTGTGARGHGTASCQRVGAPAGPVVGAVGGGGARHRPPDIGEG